MSEVFIVKRITEGEEKDIIRYASDPVGYENVNDIVWKLSILKAERYKSYSNAQSIINKLIEKCPYDSSSVYQIEKIFKS